MYVPPGPFCCGMEKARELDSFRFTRPLSNRSVERWWLLKRPHLALLAKVWNCFLVIRDRRFFPSSSYFFEETCSNRYSSWWRFNLKVNGRMISERWRDLLCRFSKSNVVFSIRWDWTVIAFHLWILCSCCWCKPAFLNQFFSVSEYVILAFLLLKKKKKMVLKIHSSLVSNTIFPENFLHNKIMEY